MNRSVSQVKAQKNAPHLSDMNIINMCLGSEAAVFLGLQKLRDVHTYNTSHMYKEETKYVRMI